MNIPLVNYYAKLINRGDYTMEQVPEGMRDDVQKRINEIADYDKKDDEAGIKD